MTAKPFLSRSGHGKDLLPFAQGVINRRPATTSLARRDGSSSSDSGAIWSFWSITCAGSSASRAGRDGRRSAVGHGEAFLHQGSHAFPGALGAQTLLEGNR